MAPVPTPYRQVDTYLLTYATLAHRTTQEDKAQAEIKMFSTFF